MNTHNMRAVAADLGAIPKPKLLQKIYKSLAGLLVMAFAVFGGWRLTWPWYVVTPIFGVGSHIFAEEWTRKAVKFMLAVVKDILATIRSGTDAKKDDPPQ